MAIISEDLVAAARDGTVILRDSARRLRRWWLTEFFALLPKRVAGLFGNNGRKYLALRVGKDDVTLELLGNDHNLIASQRIALTDYSQNSISIFLQSHQLKRTDVEIGVRVPSERIFRKKVMLASQASGAVKEIVAQDIIRKTPFKIQDIYFDYVASKVSGGEQTITVWQWITKRRYIQDALLSLSINVQHVAFVVSDGNGFREGPPPFINMRTSVRGNKSIANRSICFLSVAGLLLAPLAGGLVYSRQQTNIDELDAQIAATKARAQQVRAILGKVQEKQKSLINLRLERSNSPGVMEVWEEITRVLPSHAWLSELRFYDVSGTHERQIAIYGFSAAAPSLVGIVDSSLLFSDAILTAPVALDAAEGRERFALQAKLKRVGDNGGATQ